MTEAATTAHALPVDPPEVAPELDLMSKFDGLIAEREALVKSGVRNPFTIAKTVATASAFTGGRVALGVGMGWCEEEFDLVGQAFAKRGAYTLVASEPIANSAMSQPAGSKCSIFCTLSMRPVSPYSISSP